MYIEDLYRRLELNTSGALQYYKEKVGTIAKSHALLAVQQKIATARNTIQNLNQRLINQSALSRRNYKDALLSLTHRLDKQNPNEPLQKGFVRVWQNDTWIRKADSFSKNVTTELQWKDDRIKIDTD